MNVLIPKLYWRFFIILFFTIVFCFLLYHALFLMSTPDAPDTWLVGDWLINYQGGFVRRGLLGEVFMWASQFFGIQIVVLVVVFQLFVYLVFFVAACRLAIHAKFSVASFLLIGSPAFILFPVLDYQGAFRKEILFLALLSILCVHLLNSKSGTYHGLMFAAGAASIFIVLSHEMLVAYLPYLLCAFVLSDKESDMKPAKIISVIVPAVVVAVLLMLFARGDGHIVAAICDSLKPNLPLDCIQQGVPGAISLLDDGIASANDLVLRSTSRGTLPVYVLSALLSLLPLVLAWFSGRSILNQMSRVRLSWAFVFVASAVVASIPLFLVASDYGRLIYIHAASLSLLTLMVIRDAENTPLRLSPGQLLAWGASLLFVAGWRLIHWGASVGKTFPFLSVFDRFLE